MTVHHGDCREVLATLPAESVDSVVCDPPYHLTSIVKRFGSPDAAPAKEGATGAYARASRGFMGKIWDGGDVAFQPETWAAVLRVMKPGAHLVAFGGTRTYHRMVCAIEDAGFEVRDTLAWLYGSGFPKSHNIGKAIDRAQRGGLVREKLTHFAAVRGVDGKWLEAHGVASAASFADWTVGGHVPSDKNWQIVRAALGVTPEEEAAFEREVVGLSENGIAGGSGKHAGEAGAYGFAGEYYITAPATDAARQWQGWGTALKPAFEPIVLARKPFNGTVAANVLKHGTGGLNIDGCRIGLPEEKRTAGTRAYAPGRLAGGVNGAGALQLAPHDGLGRWPANLCHDGSDEVLQAFPESDGQAGAVTGAEPSTNDRVILSGLAARFFYTAKADAADRLGSKHPTVKPVDLMRWLVRLVTPPGGLVLDPFAGTGTTGMAALMEGMRAVLIERESEYVADINRRLAHMKGGDAPLFAEPAA